MELPFFNTYTNFSRHHFFAFEVGNTFIFNKCLDRLEFVINRWFFFNSHIFHNFPDGTLGAVYTMDHEVVPRKRPILRGTTSWDDFHGPSY
jgi:hypothetical protein